MNKCLTYQEKSGIEKRTRFFSTEKTLKKVEGTLKFSGKTNIKVITRTEREATHPEEFPKPKVLFTRVDIAFLPPPPGSKQSKKG